MQTRRVPLAAVPQALFRSSSNLTWNTLILYTSRWKLRLRPDQREFDSPELDKEWSNRLFPDEVTDLSSDPAQLLSEKFADKPRTLTQAQIECVLISYIRNTNSSGNGPAYCGVVKRQYPFLRTQCACSSQLDEAQPLACSLAPCAHVLHSRLVRPAAGVGGGHAPQIPPPSSSCCGSACFGPAAAICAADGGACAADAGMPAGPAAASALRLVFWDGAAAAASGVNDDVAAKVAVLAKV